MDVMRNMFCILLLLGVSFYLASCKMDLDPYDQTVDRVAFYFAPGSESEEKYTFAYFPNSVRVDTVNVEVQLYGNLSLWPRKVNIRRLMESIMRYQGFVMCPFRNCHLHTSLMRMERA